MTYKAELWERYNRANAGRAPRPTLLHALTCWGERPPGRAVDLGCGSGGDTLALLGAGWQVAAVDADPVGLELLRELAGPDAGARLSLERADLATYAPGPCDLVVASYSLFFLSVEKFAGLWSRLTDALASGGLFAGQFLGPEDGWAGQGTTVHDAAGLDALLAGYERLQYEEERRDGTSFSGPKRWHVHHVVARKL